MQSSACHHMTVRYVRLVPICIFGSASAFSGCWDSVDHTFFTEPLFSRRYVCLHVCVASNSPRIRRIFGAHNNWCHQGLMSRCPSFGVPEEYYNYVQSCVAVEANWRYTSFILRELSTLPMSNTEATSFLTAIMTPPRRSTEFAIPFFGAARIGCCHFCQPLFAHMSNAASRFHLGADFRCPRRQSLLSLNQESLCCSKENS